MYSVFRVNKNETINPLKVPSSNIINSQKSLANSEYNYKRVEGAFTIKKNTIISNRESISKLQLAAGKLAKEKKIDIDKIISENKKSLMVCVQSEHRFFQNMNPDLKYCFIDRELNVMRILREIN